MYQIHQHYKFWVTHPSEFLKSKLIGRTFSIQEKISLKNAQNGLKIFLSVRISLLTARSTDEAEHQLTR
jgi:hypothetical protein